MDDETRSKLLKDSSRDDALTIETVEGVATSHVCSPSRIRLLLMIMVLSSLLVTLSSIGYQMGFMNRLSNELSPSNASRAIRVSDCDCGTSTAEAEAMGCSFDTLAMAWLPPYCLDPELSTSFDHAGPGIAGSWTYYADRFGDQVLNRTELSMLADSGKPFYATQEWHITHCTFSWKKQFRAQTTGVTMEDRYFRIQHIEHCGMLMLGAYQVEPKAIAVRARVLLNSNLQPDDVGMIDRL